MSDRQKRHTMGTLGRRRAGRDGTGRLGREADASVVGEGRTKDRGRGDAGVGDGSVRECQQSTARRRRGRTESKGENCEHRACSMFSGRQRFFVVRAQNAIRCRADDQDYTWRHVESSSSAKIFLSVLCSEMRQWWRTFRNRRNSKPANRTSHQW